MRRQRRPQTDDSAPVNSEWRELTERFTEQTRGLTDAVYALPPRLVDFINVELAGFFTEDEIAFERALAANGRTGFFLQQPFQYPLLDTNEIEPQDEVTVRLEALNETLREMLADEMRARGRSEGSAFAHQLPTDHFSLLLRGRYTEQERVDCRQRFGRGEPAVH